LPSRSTASRNLLRFPAVPARPSMANVQHGPPCLSMGIRRE
jgi:hypothetical protein